MQRRSPLRLVPIVLLWLLTFCSLARGSTLGDIVYSRQGGADAIPPAYFSGQGLLGLTDLYRRTRLAT